MSEANSPKLEIGDVLSAGFGPLKSRFWGLIFWVGIPLMLSYLVLLGGATWLFFIKFSPFFMAIITKEITALEFSDFAPALWAYIAVLFIAFIPPALARAALFRFHTTGKFKGVFFAFRFGADEIRQYILLWLIIITTTILPTATLIAGIMLAQKLNFSGFMVGLIVLFFLFLPIVMVLFAIRFSLAFAQTFVEKRLRLFGSWRLTRGHFWVLFLAFAVMVILFGLLSLVVNTPANILFYMQSETGWISDPQILADLDPAEIPDLLRGTFLSTKTIIAFWGVMVMGTLVNVLQITAYSGASLFALRQLTTGPSEPVQNSNKQE